MNPALLAPLGLAALAALALPILMHLVRRIELRTTEFAALRWIPERTRPRRRLRFERPWLLGLRLALLAVLAVLLARPVVNEPAANTPNHWTVVAPGVDRASELRAAAAAGHDGHWLAAGFPSLDASAPGHNVPLASLLRELDADLAPATTLRVIVPSELGGLDGERLRLAHAIDWQIAPGRTSEAALPAPQPALLAVRHAPGREAALPYLRATLAAWNQREPGRYRLDVQRLAQPVPDAAAWLVWLGPALTAQASAWIARGGVALVTERPAPTADPLWRDASGQVIARVETLGRGRIVALPARLTPADLPILLDADFPGRLRHALNGAPHAPTRAPAAAATPRRIADQATAGAPRAASARPLDAWFAFFAALLYLCERLVATSRPREATA